MLAKRICAILGGALLGVPIVLAVAACGSSAAAPGGGGGGPGGTGHAAIALKDALGNPLTATSTTPYSPRQTCGTAGCHDVDAIAEGYHFQQGRTNAAGQVQAQADFFGDGRYFLQSDGMYGKW